MKLFTSVAVIALGLASVGANAAMTYGTNNAGTFYAGAKIGQADPDISNASSAIIYGVYGGYNFDQNFGAEAEYLTSQDKKFASGSREYNVNTLGAYGTYRYHFLNTPFYAKGKLGFAKTETEINSTADSSYSSVSDKTGLGYGIGAGYQNGTFGVEATYSKASDATVLGVGANMIF